uniref:Uncharacterized protein n=1 Tax=Heterorhabditis bacteriophora TaxID=37862 RepID=A0A1I7XLD3_HETBA
MASMSSEGHSWQRARVPVRLATPPLPPSIDRLVWTPAHDSTAGPYPKTTILLKSHL